MKQELYTMKKVSYKIINMVTLVAVLVFSSFISIGYAAINSNLSISGDLEIKPLLYERIEADTLDDTKYAKEYTDDKSTFIGTKKVYYYHGKAANNNVIFANFCWKIVRTTDTGGVKLIYNGEPSSGQCAYRAKHVGYGNMTLQTLSSNYRYGTNYTYDAGTNTFTLSGDLVDATWNDTTSASLIGKYTCLDTTVNCSNLYLVESYSSSSSAYVLPLNSTTYYSAIGESSFNRESWSSLADVGYMYNKRYPYKSKSSRVIDGTDYIYGNTFTYNNSTKQYTLSGETKSFSDSDWDNYYNELGNTHYTCWNASGTCSSISYIFYTNKSVTANGNTYRGIAFYIVLEEGKSVEKALDEMLYDNNVNTMNSPIKTVIDEWYSRNMTKYTNYLEDIVWCNDRSMSNQSTNGWNPNGGSNRTSLIFGSHSKESLVCLNKNDKFTVNEVNGNGKLKYPVGLVTGPEMRLSISSYYSPLSSSNGGHWLLTPDRFYSDSLNTFNSVLGILAKGTGNISSNYNDITAAIGNSHEVRPAVSLRAGIKYSEGDGSTEHPYIIDMNS